MSSLPVCSSCKLPVSPAMVGEWGTELEGHKVIKVISCVASIYWDNNYLIDMVMLMDEGTGIDY